MPPGPVNVLREEGLEAARYFLWATTGWHANYDPFVWRNRASAEHERIGWTGSRVPHCARRTSGR